MRLVGRQELLGKSKGLITVNRRDRDLDPLRSRPLVVRAIALGRAATHAQQSRHALAWPYLGLPEAGGPSIGRVAQHGPHG
jgi:hypothetical protein